MDLCEECDFFFKFTEEENGHKGMCDKKCGWLKLGCVDDCDDRHVNKDDSIYYDMELSVYVKVKK